MSVTPISQELREKPKNCNVSCTQLILITVIASSLIATLGAYLSFLGVITLSTTSQRLIYFFIISGTAAFTFFVTKCIQCFSSEKKNL